MRFTDVTDAAGVRGVGYAMGAAAADYDNDGHVDLFVAGVARNQLLRNRGDGSFEDVTERAPASPAASGRSAAGWFDYDNDGRLDLLVVNYVRWSARAQPLLRRSGARRAHLLPSRATSRACRTASIAIAATARSRTCRRASGHRAARRQGHERRVRRLRPRRRLDAFVTNDTRAELPVPQQRRRHVRRDGAHSPAWRCPSRAGRSRAWAPTSRTTTTTAGRTSTSPASPARRSRSSATTGARPGRSSTRPQSSGLGAAVGHACRAGARSSSTSTTTAARTSSPPTRIPTIASSAPKAWAGSRPNSLFLNDGRAGSATPPSNRASAAPSAVHRGCGVADFDADGRLDIVVLVARRTGRAVAERERAAARAG